MANALKETAIVPVSDYALTQLGADDLIEIIQDNVGDQISVGDLIRIKVPSGGSPIFTIPSLEGDTFEPKIRGILCYWRDNKAYWRKSLEEGGGNQAPDCRGVQVTREVAGLNGKGKVELKVWMGTGNRDDDGDLGPHDCATCPYGQFGSGKGGKGKACKDTRMFGLLTPDSILPVVINAPATSLKAMRKFLQQLAGKGVHYWAAVVEIGLFKTKNDDGIEYCELSPVLIEKLEGDDKTRMKAYVSLIKPMLDKVNENAAAAMQASSNSGSSFQGDEGGEEADEDVIDTDGTVEDLEEIDNGGSEEDGS